MQHPAGLIQLCPQGVGPGIVALLSRLLPGSDQRVNLRRRQGRFSLRGLQLRQCLGRRLLQQAQQCGRDG